MMSERDRRSSSVNSSRVSGMVESYRSLRRICWGLVGLLAHIESYA